MFGDGAERTRAECWLQRETNKDLKNALKWKRSKLAQKFNYTVEHEVQLYRGDSIFPRKDKMTMVSMGQENAKLSRAYIKKLDQGVSAMLWQWKLIDYAGFKEKQFQAMGFM